MADIIKSGGQTGIEKKTIEKRHRESLQMKAASISMGRLQDLMEIGFVWNYKSLALWRIDGFKSFNEWLQSQGIAQRTAQRWIQIGDAMAEYSGGKDDPEFHFSINIIKEHFSEAVKIKDITIHGLAAAARDEKIFKNYLEGNDGLSTADALKLITTPRADTKELPPAKHDDLFTMHAKIVAAGYHYDEASGRYYNDKGEEMSIEELSEFVDDETGMMIFPEVQKPLDAAKKQVMSRIHQMRRFLLAFEGKNRSPRMRELIEEKQKELEAIVLEILSEISTMRKAEEE